jgi:hypothetical protein
MSILSFGFIASIPARSSLKSADSISVISDPAFNSGKHPVTIAQRTIPRFQMSIAWSYGTPSRISGAAYPCDAHCSAVGRSLLPPDPKRPVDARPARPASSVSLISRIVLPP